MKVKKWHAYGIAPPIDNRWSLLPTLADVIKQAEAEGGPGPASTRLVSDCVRVLPSDSTWMSEGDVTYEPGIFSFRAITRI